MIREILFWLIYFLLLYISIFMILVYFSDGIGCKKKKLTKFPKISLLIPAYNEEKYISDTLKSALKIDYPKDKLDIIVIDDGSTDKTAEIVKKFKRVKLIQQKNKGKANAMNNAIKKINTPFFVCLDADCIVEPNILKKMMPAMDDDTSAVTSVLRVYKPKNLLQKLQEFEYVISIFLKSVMSNVECVHVTPGPFTIYRTKDIKEIGYFDENTIVEDLEIAFRLQKNHKKIVQSIEGDVFTHAPDTIRKLYRQRKRWTGGAVINIIRYKEMCFNPDYGDFGLFQAPSILLSFMIRLYLVLFVLWGTLFVPIINFIERLMTVGIGYFSITVQELIHKSSLYLYGINTTVFLFIVLFLGINIFWIKKAYWMIDKKIGYKEIIPLLIFFLIYYMLLSLFFIFIIIYIIRLKEIEW